METVDIFFICREGLEDPLEDQGMVSQQLEQLSTIGRCEYVKTCTLLMQLFDTAAGNYQDLLSNPSAQEMSVAIQEGNEDSCLISDGKWRSFVKVNNVQKEVINEI